MKVVVCGSRTYADTGFLYGVLDKVHAEHTINLLGHGAARGADMMAAEWAFAHQVRVWPFPAEWRIFGPAAGFIRNQRMLDNVMPDAVLAFVDKPLEESRGTYDTCCRAQRAGIPVYVMEQP